MAKYFSAIIVCNLSGGQNQFLKYRNIPAARIDKLTKFAASKGAHHVNLYEKETKKFFRQIGPDELGAASLPVGHSAAGPAPRIFQLGR